MNQDCNRLNVLQDIVEHLNEFTLEWFNRLHDVKVEAKGTADYVSKVDRDAESIARRMICEAFPNDHIVGEEYGGTHQGDFWVIDPIDGTTNFLSGLPFWAVSIAYIQDGEPYFGAVALPALGLMMSACVDDRLIVKGPLMPLIENTELAFGIGRNPSWKTSHRVNLETKLEEKGYCIVGLGSCASALAMVAVGRLAGYVEYNIKLWDCAAGHVLCRAAGASAFIHPTGDHHSTNVVASWEGAKEILAVAVTTQ